MKNSFIIIIIFFYFCTTAIAENLNIQSSNISIDKKTRLTLFKGEVVVTDEYKNTLETNYAKYDKDIKLLTSVGKTYIKTSEGYSLTGEDIVFDNKKNIITSDKPAILIDLENNNISLDNFEYSTKIIFLSLLAILK